MTTNCVSASRLIETPDDARAYYAEHLAGARTITVHYQGQPKRITVVFERDGTHVYSRSPEPGEAIPPLIRVVRRIPAGSGRVREDIRRFDLQRARLMDEIMRALSLFTVAVPEAGGPGGREKSLVYGPALAGGDHMLVVLRPGPGEARTCVSAYPVSRRKWLDARVLKRARFP